MNENILFIQSKFSLPWQNPVQIELILIFIFGMCHMFDHYLKIITLY